MISVLIAFSTIETCLYICFHSHGFALDVLDYPTWSVFALDMILNFLTDDQDTDGFAVTGYAQIAKRYIRGWFLIDLIALTPLMFFGYNLYEHYMQLFRILKLKRSFDLIDGKWIEAALHACVGNSDNQMIRVKLVTKYLILLLRQFILMAFFSFTIGALFFWYCREMSHDPYSFEHQFKDKEPTGSQKMLNSWYFAITTLTTIGYGDLHPVTAEQQVFVTVELLLGLIIFSVVIAQYQGVIADIESFEPNISRAEDMNAWEGECESFSRRIPAHLRMKIGNHFEHFWKRDRLGSIAVRWWQCKTTPEFTESPDKFFSALPSYNKKSILKQLFRDLFDRYPRFFLIDEELRYDLALHLQPLRYHAGQTILREGHYAKEVILICSGPVTCGLKRQGQFVSFLTLATAVIGDYEVLFKTQSLLTYRIDTILRGETADAFIIPAKPFKVIVKKNSKVLRRMKSFALIRLRKIANAVQAFEPEDFMPTSLTESVIELRKSVLSPYVSPRAHEESDAELESRLAALEREKTALTQSYESRRRKLITAIFDQLKLLNSRARQALSKLSSKA